MSIKSHLVEIKTADGLCDTYISHPKNDGSSPAVILFMDAFGLRPYLKSMADKIASHGYYVLLPNLFYRTSRAPVLDIHFPVSPKAHEQAIGKLKPLIQAYDFAQTTKDTSAFFDFLDKQKTVRRGSAGVIGYCMGGAVAVRAAEIHPDKVSVVTSFHAGRLVTEAADSPHRSLSRTRAKLYFAHADNDASMTAEQIRTFHEELEKSGLDFKDEVYVGAAHGFTMADLPNYNADANARHWKNLFSNLDSVLALRTAHISY